MSANYLSDYGNNYILVPPSTGSGVTASSKTSVVVSCQKTECLRNSYLSGDTCTKCPPNHTSPKGSTSASDCVKCISGFELAHEFDTECVMSENFKEIVSSKGWRLWATFLHTTSWWRWMVAELELYSDRDCTNLIPNDSGTVIDSAHYDSNPYWGPGNVFGVPNRIWLGLEDSDNVLYIGKTFDSEVELRCVKLLNTGEDAGVTEIRVQA